MPGDVVLTLSANDAGMVRKMLAAKEAAAAVGMQIDLIDKKGNKAKQSINSMMGAAALDMGKAALAFAGVGSAVAAVATASKAMMMEYEQWKSRRSDAASTFRELPNLERQMADSLAPNDNLNLDQLRAELQRIGSERHVPMRKLVPAMTSALGGKGANISATDALKAVEAQAAYGTFAGQEEFSGNPGRFLDWQKAFGGTAEEQMAMGIEAQRMARDEDSQKFWQTGGVMIPAGRQFGWDQQSGMGLYAAMTQGPNDKDGRLGTNMGIMLMRQVAEATASVAELKGKMGPERLDYIRSEKGAAIRHKMLGELSNEFTSLSRSDRKKLERQLKREGNKGVEKLHGEAKPFATALSMLDPTGPTFAYDIYKESRRQASKTPAEALAKLKTSRKDLDRSPIQQLGHQEALAETQKEQAYLKQPGLAARGIQMEKQPDLQKALGQGAIQSYLETWRRWFEGSDDILGTARANEEEMRRNLNKNQIAESIGFAQQGQGADWRNFKPSQKAIDNDKVIKDAYEAYKAERMRLEGIIPEAPKAEVKKKAEEPSSWQKLRKALKNYGRELRGEPTEPETPAGSEKPVPVKVEAPTPEDQSSLGGPQLPRTAAGQIERQVARMTAGSEPTWQRGGDKRRQESPENEMISVLQDIRRLLSADKRDRAKDIVDPRDASMREQQKIDLNIKVNDTYGREINRSTARLLPAKRLNIV